MISTLVNVFISSLVPFVLHTLSSWKLFCSQYIVYRNEREHKVAGFDETRWGWECGTPYAMQYGGTCRGEVETPATMVYPGGANARNKLRLNRKATTKKQYISNANFDRTALLKDILHTGRRLW